MSDRDDKFELDEGPQEIDLRELGDDAESDTEPCPACGAEIYEHADRCDVCGEWIVQNTGVWSGRRWWWVLLGIAGMAMVIWMLLR